MLITVPIATKPPLEMIETGFHPTQYIMKRRFYKSIHLIVL